MIPSRDRVKRPSWLACILLSATALLLAAGADLAQAKAEDRPAAWAGSFYPAERAELLALMASLQAQAQREAAGAEPLPEASRLRALILPHAGYRYSGRTAAHGALALAGSTPATVVLLGPDHRVGAPAVMVSRAAGFETPLGRVTVSPLAERLRQQGGLFIHHATSERAEHSLEVVLPWLQRALPPFELLPLVVGQVAPQPLAETLAPLLDAHTLLVVSSDLSHFLDQEQAQAKDRQSIAAMLALDDQALARIDNSACGAVPIRALLILARRLGWRPRLLHHSTSADATDERQRVVGYAAIAFYGEAPMQSPPKTDLELSAQQGQRLVHLARRTIAAALGQPPAQEGADALSEPIFGTPRGTFVTLTQGGDLRGCIGTLAASEPLRDNVRENALNAAFHDPRFRPLQASELESVRIEVSILSEPRPLAYRDADELLRLLRPEVDGVIIRQGGRSATFLPQVWAQLPRAEEFLAHLCRKAGLPGDAWRQGLLQVQTYQVQYFHEQR